MKTLIKILFTAGVVAIVSLGANAQLVPEPLSLVASPSSPGPGQAVTVEASTPTQDKNSVIFSWTVDGRSRPDLSGPGKNTIALTAGEVGSVLNVRVGISGSNGGGETSLAIRVADLALTWFAETYVPKWYKGKSLPVQNSVVSIVAVPNIRIGGSTLSPENLIFRWEFDDQEDVLSGVGEQVLRIRTSDLPRASHHIKVAVENSGGTIRKEGELFIVPGAPRVVVYPATPLGGLEFRSAPSVVPKTSRGIFDFSAEPFYFPVLSKKNLAFSWRVNGLETSGDAATPHLISLNTQGLPSLAVPISVAAGGNLTFLPQTSAFLNLFLQ